MELKNLYLIVGLIYGSLALAQKKLPKINEKYVSTVLKTLCADDMNGRSAFAPKDIQKASDYIASEFKKIGLSAYNNTIDFRQDLNYSMITNISLTINQKTIPDSTYFVVSGDEKQVFDQNATIKKLPTGKNAMAGIYNMVQDTTNKIVLVAEENWRYFAKAKGYFGKPKLGANQKGTTVFLLSNQGTFGDSTLANNQLEVINKVEKAALNNVVGVLPGKTLPNEYIIFSGHYDHLGGNPTDSTDAIFNGADDDASGTTAVIALAKYYKKQNNNNRTLIFVAFTAEEIGGYGSKFFSKSINPNQIKAMVNIEMIGKTSKWGENAAFLTGFDKSNLGKILQNNLAKTNFKLYPDPYLEQNLFYRSDNATLARLGVPAHTFSTDQIDSDKLYHSVKDDFSSMNMKNIVKTIQSIALASKSIVSGQATPTKIDKATIK